MQKAFRQVLPALPQNISVLVSQTEHSSVEVVRSSAALLLHVVELGELHLVELGQVHGLHAGLLSQTILGLYWCNCEFYSGIMQLVLIIFEQSLKYYK